MTPLLFACQNGHVNIVSYLLSMGAEYMKGDNSGNNGIHYAAGYGYYELIPILVQAGCDLNSVNNLRMNALMISMEFKHRRIFE